MSHIFKVVHVFKCVLCVCVCVCVSIPAYNSHTVKRRCQDVQSTASPPYHVNALLCTRIRQRARARRQAHTPTQHVCLQTCPAMPSGSSASTLSLAARAVSLLASNSCGSVRVLLSCMWDAASICVEGG